MKNQLLGKSGPLSDAKMDSPSKRNEGPNVAESAKFGGGGMNSSDNTSPVNTGMGLMAMLAAARNKAMLDLDSASQQQLQSSESGPQKLLAIDAQFPAKLKSALRRGDMNQPPYPQTSVLTEFSLGQNSLFGRQDSKKASIISGQKKFAEDSPDNKSQSILRSTTMANTQSQKRSAMTILRPQDRAQKVVEEPLFIRCSDAISDFCTKMCKKLSKEPEPVESEEEIITYSSGESDHDTRVAFQKMTDQERADRVAHLWKRGLAKTFGAVQVINTFGDLGRRIFLYGSVKKNVEEKDEEQQKPLPFILMPDSQVISAWNIIMMLLLLYTATYVPFKTAFVESSPEYVNTIEFAIDSLFFVDLAVNFLSAYETSDKNVEIRLSRISFMYLRTWFLFDLVSCIPFQYLDFSSPDLSNTLATDLGLPTDQSQTFLQTASQNHPGIRLLQIITGITPNSTYNPPVGTLIIDGKYYSSSYNVYQYLEQQQLLIDQQSGGGTQNYNKLIRLARLPRLYKLLRIMRLFKMVRLLKYNRNIKRLMDKMQMNPAYVRMTTLTLTVTFLVHLISCFYFMIVSFSDFEPGCWIVVHGLIDADNFTQYISALYWAFQTLTTVGYGDMQGTTMEERVFSIMWILFGVAFYSFTIGNLQSILSEIDANSSELSSKLSTLTNFARQTQLPDTTTVKIKKFLEDNNLADLPINQCHSLIDQLPAYIRSEVVMQIYIKTIHKFRFLQNKDPDFLWQFLPILKPMQFYSKDVLYRQGDHPEEVFFIKKGKVKLCHIFETSNEHNAPRLIVPFNMYAEGAYFGEMEMMLAHYQFLGRDGTAIVDSECHILVITQHQLRHILKLFPEVKTQMKQIARKRRLHHEKAITEAKVQAVRDSNNNVKKNAQLNILHNTENHIFSQNQRKGRQQGHERQNSLTRALRGAKNLERLEKNRLLQDREKLKQMELSARESLENDDDDSDNIQMKKVQQILSEYIQSKESLDLESSDDTNGSSPSLLTKESLEQEQNLRNGSNGSKQRKQGDPQNYKQPNNNESRGRKKSPEIDTSNERHDSMITYSRSSEDSPQKKKNEVKTIIFLNGNQNDQKLNINPKKYPEIKEFKEGAELDTIAEEENNNTGSDFKTTQDGFRNGMTIETNSQNEKSSNTLRLQTTSQLANQRTLNTQANAVSQKRFSFNNEKQARLFNDSIAALALNAFEINEVNEFIGQEGQKQKKHINKIETAYQNIEGRLDSIEVMLSKILQSV